MKNIISGSTSKLKEQLVKTSSVHNLNYVLRLFETSYPQSGNLQETRFFAQRFSRLETSWIEIKKIIRKRPFFIFPEGNLFLNLGKDHRNVLDILFKFFRVI